MIFFSGITTEVKPTFGSSPTVKTTDQGSGKTFSIILFSDAIFQGAGMSLFRQENL
jgi:hypothetical protein